MIYLNFDLDTPYTSKYSQKLSAKLFTLENGEYYFKNRSLSVCVFISPQGHRTRSTEKY